MVGRGDATHAATTLPLPSSTGMQALGYSSASHWPKYTRHSWRETCTPKSSTSPSHHDGGGPIIGPRRIRAGRCCIGCRPRTACSHVDHAPQARLVVGHSGAGKLRLVLATRAKSVFRVCRPCTSVSAQHLFCRFLAVTLLGAEAFRRRLSGTRTSKCRKV